jgi:hypothetical protein
MTAIKSDIGAQQPTNSTPHTPGAIPQSNARAALDWLAQQIVTLTGLAAVAQYTADTAFALAQVAHGSARKARLAARAADQRAEMARQMANQAAAQDATTRKRVAAVASVATDARETAIRAHAGLHRVRLRVSETRLIAEDAKTRAMHAQSMSRDLKRRLSSEQIALTAAVYN